MSAVNYTKKWHLLRKMALSKVRVKPYKSNPIIVTGKAICAVIYDSTSIAVTWNVTNGPCEPIQAGTPAVQLNIIKFSHKTGTFHWFFMIQNNSTNSNMSFPISTQLLRD